MHQRLNGNGGTEFWIGINGDVPKVGDSYGFAVTYSDGTTGTASAAVTGVLSSLPSHLEPAGPGSNYQTQLQLDGPHQPWQLHLPVPVAGCELQHHLAIPGQNSNGTGFSSSLTSLTWGLLRTGSPATRRMFPS